MVVRGAAVLDLVPIVLHVHLCKACLPTSSASAQVQQLQHAQCANLKK